MSGLPLAAALAALAASGLYLVHGLRLPWGSVEQPGPGLFPALVGSFLVLASGAHLLQTLRKPSGARALPAAPRWPVPGVAGSLGAFCLLLPWLGYGPTAFGLLLVTLRLFGLPGWRLSGVVALITTVASYYLFAVALGVPLPAGIWAR